MKQIAFLFFTFLGIYNCFGQKPAEIIDSVAAKEKPFIRLFPNPAKNKVEIEIKGFEAGYVQVRLIDNKGNMVRDDRRLLFSGNETIMLMFSESPGIYFLFVQQGENKLRTKLLIQ